MTHTDSTDIQTCNWKQFSCSVTYLLLPQYDHWYRKFCLKSAGKTGNWTEFGFLRFFVQKFHRPVHIPSGNLPVVPTVLLLFNTHNSHYTQKLCILFATKIQHLKLSKSKTGSEASERLQSHYQSFAISSYLSTHISSLPSINYNSLCQLDNTTLHLPNLMKNVNPC